MTADLLARLTTALADRYRIERELGAGGMATVYLAHDLKHDRKVALKLFRPELAAVVGAERFLQEIKTTANLQHPNILPLFDSGEADSFLYYVMPYVEGETLRDKLNRETQLGVEEVVKITTEVADALDYAHRQGVIHRDIKPENILLHGGRPMVADFGIALAVSAGAGGRMTETGISLGTPLYMSPEQATGERELTPQSDVYALAAVVYEMLTGEPPHRGGTAQAILARIMTAEPTPLARVRPGVPEHLETAVHRALAKVPSDRFARAAEFAEALANPALATSNGPVARVKSGAAGWNRRILVASAVAVIGVIIATTVFLVNRGSGDSPSATAAEPERLVIVPFANRTGDPDADIWGQLAAGEATRAVDRLGAVVVVPSMDVLDALRTLDVAQEVSARALAARTGATYAVVGTYTRTGETLRFGLELTNTATGELISTLSPVEGPVDSLDVVVGRVADGVAAAALAFLAPDAAAEWVGRPSPPPSAEAWRRFVNLSAAFCRSEYESVIEHGEQAIALAPEWPLPYLFVLVAYGNLGRLAPDTLADRVPALIPSMTAFERAAWDWMSAPRQADRLQAGEELFRMSPGRYWYPLAIRAVPLNRLDRARVAVAAADYEDPCYRTWPPWWTMSALIYHLTDDHDEELRIALDGLRRFPEDLSIIDAVLRAHAVTGNVRAIEALLTSTLSLAPQPQNPLGRRALVAARELRRHGHAEAAETFTAQAVAWFETNAPDQLSDLAAAYELAARWDDLLGVANAMMGGDPDTLRALAYAGIAYAQLDRQEELGDVERRLSGSTAWAAPRWRAAVAAARGDRRTAVEHLQSFFAQEPAYYYAARGMGYWLHNAPELETLWEYPQFQSLIRLPDLRPPK